MSQQLSPAEHERLVILIEELGESIQAATKILRHGYDSTNPLAESPLNNRDQLECELADVLSIVELMYENKDVSIPYIRFKTKLNKSQKNKWMHFNQHGKPND